MRRCGCQCAGRSPHRAHLARQRTVAAWADAGPRTGRDDRHLRPADGDQRRRFRLRRLWGAWPSGHPFRARDGRRMKGCAMLARGWFVLLAMSLLVTGALAGENERLSFSARGKAVAQLSLVEIRQKVPALQITVWEPH